MLLPIHSAGNSFAYCYHSRLYDKQTFHDQLNTSVVSVFSSSLWAIFAQCVTKQQQPNQKAVFFTAIKPYSNCTDSNANKFSCIFKLFRFAISDKRDNNVHQWDCFIHYALREASTIHNTSPAEFRSTVQSYSLFKSYLYICVRVGIVVIAAFPSLLVIVTALVDGDVEWVSYALPMSSTLMLPMLSSPSCPIFSRSQGCSFGTVSGWSAQQTFDVVVIVIVTGVIVVGTTIPLCK